MQCQNKPRSERDLAVEQLRVALDRALAEYQKAEPTEKAEARTRFATELSRFAEFALPR